MDSIAKMGTHKIFPLLITMALPPMTSMLVQSLYNIIDSMFVAQYSKDALTAVSFAFPLQTILIAFAVGIGVGVNSYIARKLGEHNVEEAQSAVLHGLLIALVCYILFVICGILFIQPFFKMYTNDPHLYNQACTYTYINVLFSFGCLFHICLEKVFQAIGDMKIAMAMQALGCVVNIILDPIFIFGLFAFPAMGVKGAAIATVLGQIVSMCGSFYFLTKNKVICPTLSNFRFRFTTVKNILNVGIPTICMNAFASLLVMGLNGILVKFSNVAVSVFGIYYKLQTFVYMPVSGLTQGAMPIMGYNYGAKNKRRLLDTLKYAIMIAFMLMLCGCLLFQFAPSLLLNIFDADQAMMEIGITCLRMISIGFIPATLGMLIPVLLQAMGKGGESLVVFLIRNGMVFPFAILFAQYMGLTGIWASFIVAESLGAIVACLMFVWVYKKNIAHL